MKKLFAFILAIVYLFAAVPAVCGWDNCEGECEELQHIKTEDHHQASASYLKLEPVSPAVVRIHALPLGNITHVLRPSFQDAPILSGAVPLFVRHCSFRI